MQCLSPSQQLSACILLRGILDKELLSTVAAGSEYVDGVYRVQVALLICHGIECIDLYRGGLNMQALFVLLCPLPSANLLGLDSAHKILTLGKPKPT